MLYPNIFCYWFGMRLYSFAAVLVILTLLTIGCGGKNRNGKLPESKNYIDSLTRFLFAGKSGKETALYVYDLSTDKYSLLKTKVIGKIIDIQSSPSRNYVYVITVAKDGKSGVFPFFQKARLHLLNGRTFATLSSISLGDGIQLVSSCDTDSTISVVINKIQSNMYSHVTQQKIVFSWDGNQVKDETKIFDFVKQGYPSLPKPKMQLLSENEKFSITPNEKNAVFLHGGVENPKLLARESKQKLNAVSWTTDNTIVVFSTIDISQANETLQTESPQTSTLYIFSLKENKMLEKFEGPGLKHFDVIRNLVIFDSGFGAASHIYIYDLQKKSETQIISLSAGCGLMSIPEFPQYGF